MFILLPYQGMRIHWQKDSGGKGGQLPVIPRSEERRVRRKNKKGILPVVSCPLMILVRMLLGGGFSES